MTKRFLFLALLIYALVLAAVLSRNGQLAWMAAPALAYLLLGILRAPSSGRLKAQRSLTPSVAGPDDPIEVRIEVENQGGRLVNLSLGDRLAPGMHLDGGEPFRKVFLPAGERLELVYTFSAGRGCYEWEQIEARASDPFELIELLMAAPAPGEALVYPHMPRLKHIPIHPRDTLHSAGPVPARRGGSGTDFWGVRAYRPGDPLRWLDWRRTARNPQRLFTKEFEQEEIADIGLILDARTSSVHPNGNGSLFEYTVSACASLAELFMREGNRVGLMIYGDRLPYLPPGYGKLHLNRILSELARAKPGSNFTLASLKNLPARLFPSRAVLVFISPLGENDAPVFASLRGYGYRIILVSPDPVAYAASSIESDREARLAYRAARLERLAQLQQIARFGAQVVEWRVDRPLASALSAALQRPSRLQQIR